VTLVYAMLSERLRGPRLTVTGSTFGPEDTITGGGGVVDAPGDGLLHAAPPTVLTSTSVTHNWFGSFMLGFILIWALALPEAFRVDALGHELRKIRSSDKRSRLSPEFRHEAGLLN
jgi:hypothetical protein